MKEVETHTYLFLKYTQYFYIDTDFKPKLTKLGRSIPEILASYEQYLKDYV